MISAKVRVPATSANLGPGFDTLGLAFQHYSYVTVRDAAEGEAPISITGAGAEKVSLDESNIALQAVRRLLERINAPERPARPFHLALENHIPLSRGLGSSAAARVGAIVAANEWAKGRGWTNATPQQLLQLATDLEGHPDNVAAALLGGLVVSGLRTPTGAETSGPPETSGLPEAFALQVPIMPFPAFAVFIPDTELATKTARGVLPETLSHKDAVYNVTRVGLLLASLQTGQWKYLADALHDRLHQPYRAPLMPAYEAVTKAALRRGAFGATLSGAGPSILAWIPRDQDTITEVCDAMEQAAAREGIEGRALPLEVDTRGCVRVDG